MTPWFGKVVQGLCNTSPLIYLGVTLHYVEGQSIGIIPRGH